METLENPRVNQLQPARPPGENPFVGSSGFDPDALTRALRIAGAVLVVGSASTFMLQHWEGGNDLMRYAMLVGQSLLLAATAYFVGLTLGEARSARTLLALTLATMPVSFAVLGGLVYSQFHLESLAPLPHYASWIAPSKLAALLAVAATLLVLTPLLVVAFVALARKEARRLSLSFFAGNALILLPAREPKLIVVVAGLMLLALWQQELSRFWGRSQLDTLEGKLARVMPFVPPLVMLGRVFHLYHFTHATLGGVLMMAAASLWLVLPRLQSSARRELGAWFASALAIVGHGHFWYELTSLHVSPVGLALLLGLPIAGILLLGSRRASSTRPGLVVLATIAALSTTLIACALDLSTPSAFGCVIVGVGVGVWGASMRSWVRCAAGGLVALFGLCVQVWLAVQAESLLRWSSLTVVGLALIVGAAYLERYRSRFKQREEPPISDPATVAEP